MKSLQDMFSKMLTVNERLAEPDKDFDKEDKDEGADRV